MNAEEFYGRFEFNPSVSGSLIGRGGFSSVYKVYDKVRKRYVAVKRSEVGVFSKFDLEREVKLANEIEYHPNIIRYENVERITDRAGTYDYAILKLYTEGNLDHVLIGHQLNDVERKQILTGILKGLAHLHKIPIIHGDLKAANVLMDRDAAGNWIPIIADFGLSRLVSADTSYILNSSQIAITPNYASPEQYTENEALRPNADLWAFGVITYKMIIGKLPFRVEGTIPERDTSSKIQTMVLEGKLPGDIAAIPEPYRTIVQKCLVVNPDKRVKRAEELIKLLEEVAEARPEPEATLPDAGDTLIQPKKETKTDFDIPTKVHQAEPEKAEPEKKPEAEKDPEPEKEPEAEKTPEPEKESWTETEAETEDEKKYKKEPIVRTPSGNSKKVLLLVAGIIIGVMGILYGVVRYIDSGVSDAESVALADSVAKDTSLAKTEAKSANDLNKAKQSEEPENVQPIDNNKVKTDPDLPISPAKLPQEGVLEVYTKYHDLKVFIDGSSRSKIAPAGQTTRYRLPVGQGIIFKVEYVDFGFTPNSEPMTVNPGDTIKKAFTEKLE